MSDLEERRADLERAKNEFRAIKVDVETSLAREEGRKQGLDEAAALVGAWGDESMEERILALKDKEPGK